MTLYDNKYGRLEYDATVPCIIATSKGFMTSSQFREFLGAGLEMVIEKKRVHKNLLWLADTRKHVAQPDKDTAWVAEEWNPQALKAGLKHVAFVFPENIFGAISIRKYNENNERQESKMKIGLFTSVVTAKHWFQRDILENTSILNSTGRS